MEKYRKFSDAGTSCNPFLPINVIKPKPESSLMLWLRVSLMSLLAIARLPLLLASGILIIVTDVLGMIPVVSPLLIRPLMRPIIVWVTLFLMGILCPLKQRPKDFRRLRMKRPGSDIASASVQLAVFHGFIDVLVHAVASRPSFFVLQSLDGKFSVNRSVSGAIFTALRSPASVGPVAPFPLPKGSLLFLHAVPSNGLGILSVSEDLVTAACRGQSVQLVSVKYSVLGTHYPHHLVDSPLVHVLKLLTLNWVSTANVVCLPEPLEISDHQSVSEIKVFMARLYGGAETSLDQSMYLEFIAYWLETRSLTYAKKR